MDVMPVDGKFSAEDVATLRIELLQSGLDNWQAAELVTSFLSLRGYGVSSEGARSVVTRIDSFHCNLACMQEELEQIALAM